MALVPRLAAAAASLVLVSSCSGASKNGAEQQWAEQATLEVARVNDVMAFEFLQAQSVTGDPNDAVGEPGGASTDWDALVLACGHLADEDLHRGPTGAVPPMFTTTAERLAEWQRKIVELGAACVTAAQAKDGDAYRTLADGFADAADLLTDIAVDIPDSVGCPDVVDRPRSCDE